MNPEYLTVSALTAYLKNKLESDPHLKNLKLGGELSNVRYHQNGHVYFTLKDDHAKISALMYRSNVAKLTFPLKDGMKVLCTGYIGVYEPQGNYQFYVRTLKPAGLGDLYAAYEMLKNRLEKEGLFALDHKKPIPPYPTSIAIITSPQGEAIHDIVTTIHRRAPSAKLFLYPSLVQGDQAAAMLLEKLKQADSHHHDVLIIGRGGGQMEDLWAFNDEKLAYGIYEAQTPVISAVGHEGDVTIADFVADARAATPTAAGTLAGFDQNALEALLHSQLQRGRLAVLKKTRREKERLTDVSRRISLAGPYHRLMEKKRLIQTLKDRATYAMRHKLAASQNRLAYRRQFLENKAAHLVGTQRLKIAGLQEKISRLCAFRYRDKKQRLAYLSRQIQALSPQNVLNRGYTLVLQHERVVTGISQLDDNEGMTVRFKDGDIRVRKENNHE